VIVESTSFIQDARRFSVGWRIWFALLSFLNLLAPLFFLHRPEAWATLACYALAAAVMIPLHRRRGWVRLLGVGHFQWLLLLPWLVYRYLQTSPSGALRVWMLAVILVDAVCLVIDMVDVVRYMAGDRRPAPSTRSERH
jgi:hypothetical protein